MTGYDDRGRANAPGPIISVLTPSVGSGHNAGTLAVLPLADGVNNYPANEGEPIMPTGTYDRVHLRRPLAERFWEKVNKGGPVPEHRLDLGPCWLWGAFRRVAP